MVPQRSIRQLPRQTWYIILETTATAANMVAYRNKQQLPQQACYGHPSLPALFPPSYILLSPTMHSGMAFGKQSHLSGLDEKHELGVGRVAAQVVPEDVDHPPQDEHEINDAQEEGLTATTTTARTR